MELFGLLSFVSFFTFVACEAMGLYVYSFDKRARLNRLFFASCQSLAIWCLGLLYIYQAQNVTDYWVGDKIASLGWLSFCAIFMHLTLVLTEHKDYIDKAWKLALIYFPTVFFLSWEFFVLGPEASDEMVDKFYALFNVYYLSYGFLVLFFLAKWGWRNDLRRKQMQAKVAFISILFAIVIGFTIQNFYPVMVFGERAEAVHLFMIILLAGFWYSIQRYGLFSLSSLIRPEDILKRITELVVVVDPEGTILMVNPRFEELTGFSRSEAVGAKLDRFVGEATGNICPIDERAVKEAAFGSAWGENIPVQLRASSIYDRAGDLAGFVLVGQDMRPVNRLKLEIEARKRKEAELEYSSFHDLLTGMYNRAFFENELKRLEESGFASVGVIIADIDGLKIANDTFGHGAGDTLLLTTAEMLKGIAADKGIVARIDGDEFAILLSDSDEAGITKLEEALSLAVAEYNAGMPTAPLSISTGSAVSCQQGKCVAELFKKADNNMYRVKLSQGRSVRSNMVQALMHTLGARHVETEDHAERLRDLAVELGRRVGLSQCELADLGLLAQFHDLGKVGVPDKILLKPGPLTDKEWKEMKRHTEIGQRIAQSVPELDPIARLILLHHERWDGKGYPLGLAAEQIPLECRILSIIDAYDAMTNDRPYQAAMAHEAAMLELLRSAGSYFDPRLVTEFVAMMSDNG